MKKKKLVSLVLAATMALSMAGCGSKGGDSASKSAKGSDTPLVIAWDAMSQKFSPFFAESVPDSYIDVKRAPCAVVTGP